MNVDKLFFSGDVTANLGLVRLVARQVLREGRISVGELRRRLMIEGLAKNAPALGSSISVASKVGFFEASGSLGDETSEISMGRVNLADTSQSSVVLAFVEALMAYSTESLRASEPHVPDLTCALVWLLAQDPSRPFASWGATNAADPEKAIGRSDLTDVVQNDTQWNGLRRWIHQLGFGSLAMDGQTILLSVDPATCLAWVIGTFTHSGSMSARQFLDRLAHALPVVSSGVIAESIRAARPKIPKPDSDLTSAETHALLRLQSLGLLELSNPDDADSKQMLSLGATRGRTGVVSAVEVLQNG